MTQAITRENKVCTKCAVSKSASDFYVDSRRGYLRGKCKECLKQEDKSYRTANPEKKVAQVTRWRDANAGKWKSYIQSYVEQNKDRIKEYRTTWNAQNRPRINALMAKRKARELQALPSWADLDAIKTEYALAKWCSKVTGIQYEVDHIIPLQGKKVCGLHTANNLQVIPMSDNRKKNNQFHI